MRFPVRYMAPVLWCLCWIINPGAVLRSRAQGGAYEQPVRGYDAALVSALLKKSHAIKFRSPDSAITLGREALVLSQRAGHNQDVIRSFIAIGACLFNVKGDHEQAKACFFKAMDYARNLPSDDRVLPRLYNCVGNVYAAESVYDSAYFFYFKALSILEKQKLKDTGALTLNYNNAGANFATMGRRQQALFYLKKSLALAELRKDTQMIAYGYFFIGNAYGNQYATPDTDSAIWYWNYSLPLFAAIGQQVNMFGTYVNLGHAWLDKRDLPRSKHYYDSAMALNPQAINQSSDLNRGLGMLYHAESKYGQAALYLEKALKLSNRYDRRFYRLDIYKHLAEVYSETGDHRRAFRYQLDYSRLSDSMKNEKMIATVNQLDARYRAAEKDKELVQNKLQLALAQNRLHTSRSWITGVVLGCLVLLVSMAVVFLRQRLQLQKAKVKEQSQRVAQLKAVIDGEERERSRIGRQLHDDIMVELSVVKMGLNALPIKYPSIRETVDYTNLVQQLNHTSQKLRQSAHNLMPDALLTEGLISAINYFCRNVGKLTGLRIHFQHYGELPRLQADTEISIYRIIQELVQNVIKHAKAAFVLVQLNYRERILSITVEDDGTGFDPAIGGQDHKMGLKSIQIRLKALDGVVDIHPRAPHGTSVNISLPIHMPDDKQHSV